MQNQSLVIPILYLDLRDNPKSPQAFVQYINVVFSNKESNIKTLTTDVILKWEVADNT